MNDDELLRRELRSAREELVRKRARQSDGVPSAESRPDPVVNAADGDGSLVFGTRRSIRGSHRDDLEDIDGALHRAVRCLRDGIDADAIR
ncbi:hypothetical protein DJ71_03910, partial [Halorubrum sp. E3]